MITGTMGVVVLFFAVRALERALMFHPRAYDGNASWTPPAHAEEHYIDARDGTRLHVWRYRALAPAARAVILYNHGNGGTIASVRQVGDVFSRRGFDVVIWDYRGYGRSGGSVASDEATFLEDGSAVLAHAASPKLPVVLWGQSLGTVVAADLAASQPCAALVLESGLASGYDFARTQVTWLPTWLHTFAKFTFDSAGKLPRVRCPVLVVHGEADPVIAPEHGRLLFAAAAHPRKRLLTIPEGGHWLAASPGFFDQVAAFLDEALPSRMIVAGP